MSVFRHERNTQKSLNIDKKFEGFRLKAKKTAQLTSHRGRSDTSNCAYKTILVLFGKQLLIEQDLLLLHLS